MLSADSSLNKAIPIFCINLIYLLVITCKFLPCLSEEKIIMIISSMPRPKPILPTLPKSYIWASKVAGDLLLGKVNIVTRIGLDKVPCLKVRVPENRYFEFMRFFYRVSSHYWALDPESKCGVGDVITIRKANERERYSSTVPYFVDKVVFKHGNMIDPITKRHNYHGVEYEDEVRFRSELVQQIYNDPLEEKQEPLSHDKRREFIKRRIAHRLSTKKIERS